MKYDGVVIRLEGKAKFVNGEIVYDPDTFKLFLVDPKTQEMQDGINISDHREIYKDMRFDQLMVVSVVLKDGTKKLDDVDLDEFIHGEKYDTNNNFVWIQDILLFTISKAGEDVNLNDLLKQGKFSAVAMDCIEKTKNQLKAPKRAIKSR